MRVVIDTNVLLVSISSKSKYHPIYQAVLNGSIELCFSNSILEEYEEILSKRWNPDVAQNVVASLLKSPHAVLVDPRFKWLLINQDPDDDKFVDCAIAANAVYLATNDAHFNKLKNADTYPPINILNVDELLALVSEL